MNPARWLAAIIAMFTATAAGAALIALPLLPHSRPAAPRMFLDRCTTTVGSSYRTGYGGYSRAYVASSTACAYIQAKALCKKSNTSGTTRYGPTGKAPGFQTTAYCHSDEALAAAWYSVAGVWHRKY